MTAVSACKLVSTIQYFIVKVDSCAARKHLKAKVRADELIHPHKALLKAIDAAEAQEERAVLWQILVSLAEVEAACGNGETAERLRDKAREVVGYIVEHAGELRETFLARPEVVSLFYEF